jgi:hypothetical protein
MPLLLEFLLEVIGSAMEGCCEFFGDKGSKPKSPEELGHARFLRILNICILAAILLLGIIVVLWIVLFGDKSWK